MAKFSQGLPVNELGEIVVSSGSGSSNIVGTVPINAIPVDSITGGLRLNKVAQLATDGAVNYLVDAQGKPIRQVIQIAQSFVPAVRQSVGDASDTNHVTLANIPVPGGLMGPNGQLRIFLFGQFTTTGTKYLAVDVGGVNVGAPSYSGAQVNCGILIYFNNAGATNQQKSANAGSHPFTPSNNAIISSSVNTDVPFNIVAKVKWGAAAGAAGADNFTLLGYTVEAVYAP